MAFIPSQPDAELIIESPAPKKRKTFKELYHSDPAYRKRHLDYVTVKVPCPDCGTITARANMSKHRLTKKHQRAVQQKANDELIANELADSYKTANKILGVTPILPQPQEIKQSKEDLKDLLLSSLALMMQLYQKKATENQ